ncbi:monovalent cation/H(+) antiporter subunit G [Lentibacillus saliphilus]|uniref:monovalent cation/H(+) antiporter subunit G n=1 Tax=Lentibacillus saliphilus TaxID=2737028 RepID=UPI001C304D27|nr:monovalent cation/H(+) antiporter subunit G [Lentibacillus saliphilus]
MIETGIDITLNISVSLFILIGTFFVLSSSLGIARFPDIYTRLHAATKASTLGISSMLIGTFLFLYAEHDIVSGKLLLAIVFILLTAPVSGHMISRAAHKSGVKPVTANRSDAYEDALQKHRKNS